MSELYFDYAATTPIDDRVVADMLVHMGQRAFGNPASTSHQHGQHARQAVEQARGQVAALIGAQANQVVWTSGATESNNLALKGVFAKAPAGRRHLVTSCIEHKAVIDSVRQLEQQGVEVTWLRPGADGLIHPEAVADALRDDTLLVSLMLVNNELGTLTDIRRIGERVRERGALFHVDAAQATGKVAIDLSSLAVDLMSISAHKTYGPKGIGALYVGDRARAQVEAQIHGGGHEQGLRSGTLATHQIVGMGSAYALAGAEMVEESARIQALSNRLRDAMLALPGVALNGDPAQRIPHTLNFSIDRFAFSPAVFSGRLALSSTSACNSASNAPSHVLLALGLNPMLANQSVRISFGRFTTNEDVDQAIEVLRQVLA
ncbi:aminotransferase class V-fold PLP-dependent enzyme [Pseudomonas sp. DTU_2021_1001937_2_SI_NGA_ILE_001]|uniref:cysteine desulfurase family protein n=1 Tax=Pseudomonas sp. DTU_2021_1001937_2_SI_NGA_ILE_001 TaxID=3077589 RepID=UPI0028FC1028|nr:aminotransferase class V-fold PLP-dependent enzyme [Pseudomonas sp. DTU_2021_1001937_2_SI_NGA_ILE_001]WNW11465.1 aminotransferase class V-fold PLP-dependent enzyme [Pseudomonas sp. DTU_2021_1001937_2_SI_NGA_ILE_001]